MAKVLLVEDDNNLREIYEARLQAEGYNIVSARDGEEALVVAKAELPDLVISDVMMPKISGFEMLDILRNTEGLKDVKVIMLTALGQAEDQTRADSLGADRYLVKSQVTLEDIVNAAQQLLGGADTAATPAADTTEPTPVAPAEPAPSEPAPETPASESTPAAEPVAAPAPEPPEPATPPVIPLAAAPPDADDTAAPPTEPQMPPTPASTAPDVPVAEPEVSATPTEPVSPLSDTSSSDDDQQTNAEESATVEQQIESFVASQPGTPLPAAEPAPETPAAEPETTTPETTPEQEQVLNDALTSLSGDAQATPSEPASMPADTPATDTTAAPPADSDEAGTTTHKKVIVPITEGETPKKSLDELLAEENAKETAELTGAETAPTDQPPKPPANKGDFDPNSIAL